MRRLCEETTASWGRNTPTLLLSQEKAKHRDPPVFVISTACTFRRPTFCLSGITSVSVESDFLPCDLAQTPRVWRRCYTGGWDVGFLSGPPTLAVILAKHAPHFALLRRNTLSLVLPRSFEKHVVVRTSSVDIYVVQVWQRGCSRHHHRGIVAWVCAPPLDRRRGRCRRSLAHRDGEEITEGGSHATARIQCGRERNAGWGGVEVGLSDDVCDRERLTETGRQRQSATERDMEEQRERGRHTTPSRYYANENCLEVAL